MGGLGARYRAIYDSEQCPVGQQLGGEKKEDLLHKNNEGKEREGETHKVCEKKISTRKGMEKSGSRRGV